MRVTENSGYGPDACAHCGLPVTRAATAPRAVLPPLASPGAGTGAPLSAVSDASCAALSGASPGSAPAFCCGACRLAALIMGRQEQGEQAANMLRLGLGALLAMNVMMVSLLLYSGSVETGTIPLFRLTLLYLATPALAILLPPFLSGAARELSQRRMSIDFLIALGSLCAFSLSAVNALRGTGEVYFDTATMLPVLVTVGKLVEATAKRRASDLLQALEALLPETALLVTPAGCSEVALDTLRPGDLVRVRPGERVAVDGSILEGTSSIEEASFSGEFLPRSCAPGDRVIAGTVNGTGSLLVRAQRTGEELLLHGIAAMVQDAWSAPSATETLARKAASLFLPLVLLLAAGALGCRIALGEPGAGLLSALSVLAVACPCSMGIAAPLATSLAVARAARAGIVVRGGRALEEISRVDTVFLDKTGTLTAGKPVLKELTLCDPQVGKEELLGRLAALESAGEHALGRCIVEKARECGVPQGAAERVEVSPGWGIGGVVTWGGVAAEVKAGTSLFVGCGAAPEWAAGSGSVVYAAWGGRLRGRLLFGDAVRPGAAACVAALSRQGVQAVLLSGDRLPAAAAVAREVGIERVEAPRDPTGKLAVIREAVAAGKTVAMVGDGVNDAPALAAAHAGVALGTGMELARQSGNVVILSGRLAQLPWLVALSRHTGRIVRANLAIGFAYNMFALAAAAAGMLHPLLAAAAMVASSLTVSANSLRIARFPGEALPEDGTP